VTTTRRQAMGALLGSAVAWSKTEADARQATGLKIGELTPDSAVIWTRRTAASGRLADGILRKAAGKDARAPQPGEDITKFEGACPGGNGYVRLEVEPVSGRGGKRTFDWAEVDPAADFVHQFHLNGLEPERAYRFAVKTREARGKHEDALLTGQFRTAPKGEAKSPVRFLRRQCLLRFRRPCGKQPSRSALSLEPHVQYGHAAFLPAHRAGLLAEGRPRRLFG
jgi:phosphodiesterase/alkaline phosphatase D-like protein